jgi:hypothetical protein
MLGQQVSYTMATDMHPVLLSTFQHYRARYRDIRILFGPDLDDLIDNLGGCFFLIHSLLFRP